MELIRVNRAHNFVKYLDIVFILYILIIIIIIF